MSPPCMPTARLITQTPEWVEVPTVTALGPLSPQEWRVGVLASSQLQGFLFTQLGPGPWDPELWGSGSCRGWSCERCGLGAGEPGRLKGHVVK